MSIVTRKIINERIKFEDFINEKETYRYNFEKLSLEIDKYKNFLENYGAKKGESVLIGVEASITQISLIFACLELGLTISIVDYHRKDSFNQYKYMDPKTNILLPIEYFITHYESDTEKIRFFQEHCNKTIFLNDIDNFDYTKNKRIYAKPDTIIMKCTSSGTTDTPKLITHTHEFFYELIKRNSVFFDKVVGLSFNLNHGSSFATYFLPALYSKKVKGFKNFNTTDDLNRVKEVKINHLLLPYTRFLDRIKDINNSKLTYYTLSVIPSELKKEKDSYKDIISFFGSNETSGPVLINNIKRKDFRENTYRKFDNFYDVNIVDKMLNVTLPVYNKTINTNDCFEVNENSYEFIGRRDLKRINGRDVPLKDYNEFAKEKLDADLVYDFVYQVIYLAIWTESQNLQKHTSEINDELKRRSDNNHFLKKSKVLDKSEFLTGVKLDQELLREYFRRYV